MSHQIIISVLFFILACYLGVRVICYLPVRRGWKWLFFLVCLVASENFLIHRLLYLTGQLAAAPQWFSLGLSVAQAFVIVLALLSLAREAVLVLWFIIGRTFFKPRLSDPARARSLWLKRMGWLSLALCGLAVLITGQGVYNAMQLPRVEAVEIRSPHIPPGLDGFKIAQLSDLHVGSGFDASWLKQVVERTNALKPDLIALTGDMLDGRAMQMQAELAPLNALNAPYGVFVIEGNHEYYTSYGDWLRYMESVSAHTLLRNQGVMLTVDGAKLGIAGARDILSDRKRLPPELDALAAALAGADYKILLWHRPKQAELAARAGFDLMLAGHTHGGQFFPGNLLVAIPNKFANGLYNVDGMALYVNPGSCLWGRVPLRLGVQSEITLFTLRSEAGAGERGEE